MAAQAKLVAAWPDGKPGLPGTWTSRVRLGKAERRALATDRLSQQRSGHAGDQIGERNVEEDRRPPPVERCEHGDHEPDRTLGPDARQRDEHVVEHTDAVVDDPALES